MKFTIITPSYNQAQFLEETIISVHSQDYKNFEHFVVDGGSSDDSVAVIKKHTDKITWWVSEKDKGQTEAINKGLKRASGDVIMWLNSDDVLLPGALKKAEIVFRKNPSAIMLHGKSELFGKNRKVQVIGKKQKDLKLKYLAYIPFPQPASFFRKRLIDETGLLDESLHYGMDYELLVRAALNYDIVFCDEIFSRYRLHEESKTNESLKFCKDWNIVFSRVLNSFAFASELKKKFSAMGFYEDKTNKYTVRNKFSSHNIEKAFLYHLQILMHFNYSEINLARAKEIAKEIKRISPAFYKQQRVGVINFRSSFLNKYLITLMRNFTRR